ncbi:MAG: preprotein translocase subunit SecE [Myxococcales bacterium]|nr:preprotein translocase subunit SecE [Polyangiaceae bacterium]MDW8251409.1 preprotein translocase subunit SecE [Myxococcales bacterium]
MATKEQEKEAKEGESPRDEDRAPPSSAVSPSPGATHENQGASEEGEEDHGAPPAGTLGATRYVMTGFFLAIIAVAYVLGRTLGAIWGRLAEASWFQNSMAALARVGEEERSEISVTIGALVALGVGVHLYRRPDVRQWTNEVASEMSKVTWPDKHEVTNSTIIVIVTSAFATLYLALLDRFWGFVTNLVYGS